MRGSPYADLNRPPLREHALRRALVVTGGFWTDLRVLSETGSTNADVVNAARAGAPEGLVVIAESQTAGRGRLGRHWQSPARAGITFSTLLRPPAGLPSARLGWLPLLAGVALAEAVGRVAVVEAALKWPNDLLVRSAAYQVADGTGYGKCAGLLAEAVTDAAGAAEPPPIVLGVGLNVSQAAHELPPPPDPAAVPATSLTLAGAAMTDRDPLLRAILRTFAEWYGRWRDSGGDADSTGLREAYRQTCVTLGRTVVVALPNGALLSGRASDVDTEGRLVLATAHGDRAIAAGDVRHVR
jgi:BirA family biotin operon repressor/biotin-[acetyl-CoA-carboxylase] ligase